MSRTKLLAALGVLAIAALPVAGATAKKPPHPAHPNKPGKNKTHTVAYKAKGVVKTVDAAGKKVTITVGTGKGDTNKHSRAWSGKDVSFDLSNARISVNHDTNGDGNRDLADVKAGDKAHVLAKLARNADISGPGPYAAKKANFKTAEPTPPPPPTS